MCNQNAIYYLVKAVIKLLLFMIYKNFVLSTNLASVLLNKQRNFRLLNNNNRMPIINERITKTLSDKTTLCHLSYLSGEEDFKRLGLLGNNISLFQLTRVNRMFSVCRS